MISCRAQRWVNSDGRELNELQCGGNTGQILVTDDYVTVSRRGLRAFINEAAKAKVLFST